MRIEYEGKAVEAPDLLIETGYKIIPIYGEPVFDLQFPHYAYEEIINYLFVNGEPVFELPDRGILRIDVIGDLKEIKSLSTVHVIGNVNLVFATSVLGIVGTIKSVKKDIKSEPRDNVFVGAGDEVKYCNSILSGDPSYAVRTQIVLKITDFQQGTLVFKDAGTVDCVGNVSSVYGNNVLIRGDVEFGKTRYKVFYSSQRDNGDLFKAYNELLIAHNKKHAEQKTGDSTEKTFEESTPKVEEKVSVESTLKTEEKISKKAEQRKFVIEAMDAEGQKKVFEIFFRNYQKGCIHPQSS